MTILSLGVTGYDKETGDPCTRAPAEQTFLPALTWLRQKEQI
jgi:hypothetical protein